MLNYVDPSLFVVVVWWQQKIGNKLFAEWYGSASISTQQNTRQPAKIMWKCYENNGYLSKDIDEKG